MSKVDANLYFLQIEDQYKDAKESLDELNALYSDGVIDNETLQVGLRDFQDAQLVYDTARIMISKLNQPRDMKRTRLDKVSKDWYKYLSIKTKEGIYNEDVNVITDLKELVKKAKDKGEIK